MRKSKKIQHRHRGQRSKNLIHQYKSTRCPHCGRQIVYSNESISALVQCNNCKAIFAVTIPSKSSVNSESLISKLSTKTPDENVALSQMQTKQERTISAPKLFEEGERIVMNKTSRVRRIEVGRPKSSLHIMLAIVSGMTVGLVATLLLKLMGR